MHIFFSALLKFTDSPGAAKMHRNILSGKWHFTAVIDGKSLLSFIVYSNSKKEDTQSLQFYWGKQGKANARFVRKFGVSPAKYLLEESVRRNITKFNPGDLTTHGRRALRVYSKRGLIKVNSRGIATVQKPAIETLRRRELIKRKR